MGLCDEDDGGASGGDDSDDSGGGTCGDHSDGNNDGVVMMMAAIESIQNESYPHLLCKETQRKGLFCPQLRSEIAKQAPPNIFLIAPSNS